ncbi:MAG: HD domain-containing protein [Bacteroidales bacterium]|nr:HD domain-containing protein [Bacteroidales bacterium]
MENQPTDSPIIQTTIAFVKQHLAGGEGGHDWWHIYRVWKMARRIAVEEQANPLVVELAALLHDIADPKFHGGDEEIAPRLAADFLAGQGVDKNTIDHVVNIIRNMSFKSSLGQIEFHSKELEVVQDADRLDAIGAIGIARAFNYGGFKNRPLYDPEIKPKPNQTKEEYKKSDAPTINHFYEKLLLLKDKMNTATGKRIAEKRHHFILAYLERFYAEWNGIQ